MSRLVLSPADLEFLLGTHAVSGEEGQALGRQLRTDGKLRRRLVDHEEVYARVLQDDQILLKISPGLLFEILLRKARRDLEQINYTMEQTGRGLSVPVFDTEEVLAVLDDEEVLVYLAQMLASFTRAHGQWIQVRGKGGVWRRMRYSDLDIWSLMRLAEAVEPGRRLVVYQRIADLCLFLLGMFPDHTELEYRYPLSGEVRRKLGGRGGISPDEYETRGRQFYRLAAEARGARGRGLDEILWTLHESFLQALKPLNFIALHYLQFSTWRTVLE